MDKFNLSGRFDSRRNDKKASGVSTIFEVIGDFFLLSKKKELLRRKLFQAGYNRLPKKEAGILFLMTFVLTIGLYLYFLFSFGLKNFNTAPLIAFSVLFIICVELAVLFCLGLVVRIYIEAVIFRRVQEIDKSLPLFLREFSTNLKAGREFVDALEYSLSAEMNVLRDEIMLVVIRIRSGEQVESALYNLSRKYDLFSLRESFEIIHDSYKGGGALAEIIDRIAENLEVIQYMRKNAIANVANYVIFMGFVALLVAPLLFALSYNMLTLIDNLFRKVISQGSSSYLPSFIGALDIDFDLFILFSKFAVGIIAGSAAAIMGVIKKGNLKGSVVMILVFIICSVLVYEFSLAILIQIFKVLFKLA